MALDFEITGNLTREDAQALRQDLAGVQIGFSSGFAGERILKVIGNLTREQLAALREFLLRLLGDDRIGNIKITRDSIEIGSVSGKNLAAAKTAIIELSARLAEPK